MAESKETLCTRASVLAGGAIISSFADGSKEADAAAALYEGVVKAGLSNHRWGFALLDYELGAALSAGPVVRWDYAYALPTEPVPLRVWGVFVGDRSVPFDRRSDMIYTDADPASTPVLTYSWRVPESEWDEDFAMAIVWDLAIAFAGAFDRTDRIQTFQLQSRSAWAMAKNASGQGRTSRSMLQSGRILALR